MAGNSAAMELKVLISVLQSGTALQTLLNQTNQLSTALGNLQKQAASGGTTPPIVPGLKAAAPAADEASRAIQKLEGAVNGVVRAVRFLTGGFLALQSVRFLKDLADVAARAEVLQTTLHVVALNAGVMSTEIDKVDRAIQKLGITSSASRQALIQMMQAKLDVSWAPKLARAAQDLAVVSGMNSSATFQRLLLNIQQMDALGLRWMGLMVSREQAERKWAAANNTVISAMSRRQQVEAFMIETHERLLDLSGAYEASMDDVGKQLLSLERLSQTLKETIGDSLLPAYSALVSELGHLFEQLIVIAKVQTANKDGAVAIGEAVRVWAIAVREWIVWGAQHIEIILSMIKWIVILKLAIWGIRTVVWIGGGAIAFIEFLVKANMAVRALIAGQIGLAGALAIVRSATVVAAIETTKLATAQTAAAGSAGIFTIAIRSVSLALGGLSTVWLGLAALLAVPIIGYIYYKEQTQKGQTLSERFQEIQKNKDSFSANIPKQLGGETEDEIFQLWQKQRAGLVADIEKTTGARTGFLGFAGRYLLKDKGPVQDAFRAEMAQGQGASDANRIYDELLNTKREIDTIQNNTLELEDATTGKVNEGAAALREVGKQRLTALQTTEAQLTAQLLSTGALNTADIAARNLLRTQEAAWAAEQKFLKARDSATTKPGVTPALKKDLDAAKAAIKQAEDDLAVAVSKTAPLNTDEYRRQRKIATDKAREDRRKQLEDERQKAEKELFGGKFTFPGKVGDEVEEQKFTQGMKNYELLLDRYTEANEEMRSELSMAPTGQESAMAENIHRSGVAVREALKVVSQSVTDASFDEFVAGARRYAKASGDIVTANNAIAVARISARQERFAYTAPIVGEQKEIIEARAGKEIEALKQQLDRVKNHTAAQQSLLEEQFKRGELTLAEYYRARRDLITLEGNAELNLQQAQIRKAQDLAAAERDPRKKAVAQTRVESEIGAYRRTIAETERRQQALTDEQQERHRQLVEQTKAGLLAFAAMAGGEAAAIADLYGRMAEEHKKSVQPLEGADRARAEELLHLKLVSEEYEIHKKFRQEALNIDLKRLELLNSAVELERSRREVEASRDRRLEATGDITAREGERRRNARTFAAMGENIALQDTKAVEMAAKKKAFAEDEFRLNQRLNDLVSRKQMDPAEAIRQMTVMQQEHAAALGQVESEIVGLSTAYQELASSVEFFGNEIKMSIINGFADALTQTIVNINNAGQIWESLFKQIATDIVGSFTKNFVQGIGAAISGAIGRWMGGRFVDKAVAGVAASIGPKMAAGGPVTGPGTGTSDSIPAMLSAGEHVMPAAKAQKWMPLLEGIRLGTIMPLAMGGVVGLQSIADLSLIPRRYANGGVVVSDGGASAVTPGGGGGGGSMIVSLHPDALNMSMREWLEHEVVRQQGRR